MYDMDTHTHTHTHTHGTCVQKKGLRERLKEDRKEKMTVNRAEVHICVRNKGE
jgi:hypothetical protein